MYENFIKTLEELNGVSLNFNEGSLFVMNIVIAFIMFGVALGIKKQDFLDLKKNPKPVITGFVAQFVLLPAFTFLLIISIKLPVAIALGMLLVAACPGGNVSNFITSLAKGNIALSVSLTAIADLASVIMTPLNFTFWGNLYLETLPLVHPIHIPFSQVMETILLLMALPLTVGMFFSHKFPELTKKIVKPIKLFSLFAFFAFVAGALAANFGLFMKYIHVIFPIVIIHNLLAYLIGWSAGGLMRVGTENRKTITIEIGIQNSGLALILFFNHKIFPDGYGGVAFIAAWWGVWHIITGLIISTIWARYTNRQLAKQLKS